jgi:YaiO family outer membrane protein
LRPENEDVWRAEIEALSAAGGDSQRQEAERLRQEAQARFPRSPWTSAAFETAGTAGGNPVAPPLPAAGSARATQVEAGYAYEGLSNGYADWRSSYLWTDHVYGERKVIYGVLRQTQRFDLRDREIRAGMSYPLAERWTATLEAGASPDHNVLPKRSLTGELAHSYTAGWGVSAGLTRTQYDTVRSDSGRVGVERYIADFRLAYTVSLARLQGNGSATTHKLQAAYYYSARSNLAIALVTGQEVSSEPAGVVTTDVRSVTLNGLHWFQPRWAVSYEFLTHRQGDSYTRKGVQIGLRHVF